MAMFADPFDALLGLQQALDSVAGPATGSAAAQAPSGAYPLLNVFRKGDDFAVIAELPGVQKSDLDIQVKGNTIRVSPARRRSIMGRRRACIGASVIPAGSTARSRCRSRSMPIAFRPNTTTACSHCCCRAAKRDKPRTIKLS